MIEIAIWGLAGLLAVVSTLPVFVTTAGHSGAVGRAFGWAVSAAGIICAAFLVYAASAQSGTFDAAYPIETPGPVANPFLAQ